MAVYSNLPTFTYVKWDNMMITYNGQIYPIQNSYTNNKYVYFDSSNPYELTCSNEKKTETGGRFLIIINEKGIHTLVPHEELVVTFDGDNADLIAEKVFGIYESNAQFDERFASIETDIEGVKTTVGRVERENNEIKETVSTIDQKADQISQEVKKVEKSFNESQDTIDLRERLNKSIIEVNSSLGIFKSYFNDVKTGSIEEKTKVEINTHIDILTKNKDEMILQVNRVEVLMEQGGFTDKLNSLTSSKTAAINAIENLITLIKTAISDNNFVPSEITMIVDAFGKASTKVNMLKNSCDDCIFLGTGGSVVEELSRLDMKANGIILSVSKTEESLKNTLSVNKAQAQSQIQDLHTEISKFKQALKTIFEDGSVSEIEKGIINEHYGKLDEQKKDIDNLYNTYISDPNLSESQRSTLSSTYNTFVKLHDGVKNKINEVISDGFVNDSEMAQVESELLKYEDQSNQLLRSICNALDDIEINKNNKAVEDAKNELKQEINDVDIKVGDLDNTINTTFKDNVIDEAERNSIKQNLNILSSEKADIDNQYNQLYQNKHLSGQLKIDFKSAYDDFVSKYNSLVDVINGILDKPTLIEDSDRRSMDDAYELMNTSLASFTTVVNKVIESIAKKEAESVKSELDKDIEDIHVKIDNLDTSIDGTFANNILDKAERKDIQDNLNNIKREKIDVDNQYNQLIQSTYLDGQLKIDYMNKYEQFVSKFNSLEKIVTGILEKVDLIDDNDRSNINSAQDSLNIVIGELVTLSNKVIEYIGKKQSDSSFDDLSGQLGDLNDKVDNIIVDAGEAISDNILDKSERQTLKESLKNLNTQKSQVDAQYNLIYKNPNINNLPIKEELKTSYDTFNKKYNVLIQSIENILDKEENIIESDRLAYSNAYDEYKVAISDYTSKLQLANEAIFNKGIENAKEQLGKEISDVSTSLENLSRTMEGVFKDGILSESEKIAIRQNLKNLEIEKLDIDKTYNTLYSNSNLVGSSKTNLKSSYDNYIEKYNNLISVINDILEKEGLIDSTDQSNLNKAFDLHKNALGDFKEKYNLALDSVTNKSVEDAKQQLKQEISEVGNAVNGLQQNMEGVFKDGILSESEKLSIKQNLQALLIEKTDIDKQYSTLYNNKDLLGDIKTNLKLAYDDYNSKYNSLVEVINNIINKSGIIGSEDKSNLDKAFENHRVALGLYTTRATEAIDSIAKKKSDDAYNDSKNFTESKISVLQGEIDLKVSQDDIISKINLTPEKIKINTNLLDLTGNLDLQGRFKCWKSNSDKTGNYLNLEGAMLFGYNKTGGTHPVFASGLWTDENMGYFSVGYTRADVSDENGCLYISPQSGNNGCRLSFSRLTGSATKSTNLLFQKDGTLSFVSNLRGQQDADTVYTYTFDSGVSVRSFMCDNLRCKSIFPLYTGTYDLGSVSQTFKDLYAYSISCINSQLEMGTITQAGKWERYGALAINSSNGYIFPAQGNGSFSLGTGTNRFHVLNSVNPVNVSSDSRHKTDIHYLDEEKMPLNIIDGENPRVEQNMQLTTRDMYDFIKNDLRLASYRYKVNLEKGITDVDYNFIAQDILYTKVGSEIIKLEDKNDLNSDLSYNQGNLISTVIGALQEEIRKRDDENKILTDKIESLELKIDKLLQLNIK